MTQTGDGYASGGISHHVDPSFASRATSEGPSQHATANSSSQILQKTRMLDLNNQLMSSIMPETSQPSIIAVTGYSTIRTCVWERNIIAVIKGCQNAKDPRARIRWQNEVEALKIAGTHEHTACLYASDPLALTLTLRLEPGRSVDKYVDVGQHCTLSHAEGQMILRQMADALSHLHARRLVHDDVKPENIMWDRLQSRAVLIDFGAALDYGKLPQTYFNPSGTPSYAPPEFLQGRKGPEGDIWALGIVMLFVWGHIELPHGEWLLPGVWDEGGDIEMKTWLDVVDKLGESERKQGAILGNMLKKDPEDRIGSLEIMQRLTVDRPL